MFSSVIASPSTSPLIRPSRTTSTRSQRPISSGSSDETTTMPTPLAREVAQDAVDLGLGADVDAARRLVEEDHPRARPTASWRSRPSAGCRPTATRPARRCRRASGRAGRRAGSPARPRVSPIDRAATASRPGRDRAPRRWRRSTDRGTRRRPCGPRRGRRCRCRCCRGRCRIGSGLPSSIDLAARALVQPADALDDLAAAGADQPGDAEDLALAQREGDVAEPPCRRSGRAPRAASSGRSLRASCFGG